MLDKYKYKNSILNKRDDEEDGLAYFNKLYENAFNPVDRITTSSSKSNIADTDSNDLMATLDSLAINENDYDDYTKSLYENAQYDLLKNKDYASLNRNTVMKDKLLSPKNSSSTSSNNSNSNSSNDEDKPFYKKIPVASDLAGGIIEAVGGAGRTYGELDYKLDMQKADQYLKKYNQYKDNPTTKDTAEKYLKKYEEKKATAEYWLKNQTELADKVINYGKTYSTAKEDDNKVEQVVKGVSGSIGNLLASIPLGGGNGITGIATTAYGGAKKEAEEMGLGDKATQYALINAGIEAGSELVMPGAKGLKTLLTTGSLKQAVKEANAEGVKGFIKEVAKEYGQEAGTELAHVIHEQFYKNEEGEKIGIQDYKDIQEYLNVADRINTAGLSGAVMGGIFQGGANLSNKNNNQTQSDATQTVDNNNQTVNNVSNSVNNVAQNTNNQAVAQTQNNAVIEPTNPNAPYIEKTTNENGQAVYITQDGQSVNASLIERVAKNNGIDINTLTQYTPEQMVMKREQDSINNIIGEIENSVANEGADATIKTLQKSLKNGEITQEAYDTATEYVNALSQADTSQQVSTQADTTQEITENQANSTQQQPTQANTNQQVSTQNKTTTNKSTEEIKNEIKSKFNLTPEKVLAPKALQNRTTNENNINLSDIVESVDNISPDNIANIDSVDNVDNIDTIDNIEAVENIATNSSETSSQTALNNTEVNNTNVEAEAPTQAVSKAKIDTVDNTNTDTKSELEKLSEYAEKQKENAKNTSEVVKPIEENKSKEVKPKEKVVKSEAQKKVDKVVNTKTFKDVFGKTKLKAVEKLSVEQKTATKLAKEMGREVILYEADNKNAPLGFFKDDTIYVNSDNKGSSLMSVLGHETFHSLKNTDSKTFNELIDWGVENFSTREINKFLAKIDNEAEVERLSNNPRLLSEEMLAESFGNDFANKEFWNSLEKTNKTLFDKVKDFVYKILKKAENSTNDFLTKKHIKELRTEFESILGKLTNTEVEAKTETKTEVKSKKETKKTKETSITEKLKDSKAIKESFTEKVEEVKAKDIISEAEKEIKDDVKVYVEEHTRVHGKPKRYDLEEVYRYEIDNYKEKYGLEYQELERIINEQLSDMGLGKIDFSYLYDYEGYTERQYLKEQEEAKLEAEIEEETKAPEKVLAPKSKTEKATVNKIADNVKNKINYFANKGLNIENIYMYDNGNALVKGVLEGEQKVYLVKAKDGRGWSRNTDIIDNLLEKGEIKEISTDEVLNKTEVKNEEKVLAPKQKAEPKKESTKTLAPKYKDKSVLSTTDADYTNRLIRDFEALSKQNNLKFLNDYIPEFKSIAEDIKAELNAIKEGQKGLKFLEKRKFEEAKIKELDDKYGISQKVDEVYNRLANTIPDKAKLQSSLNGIIETARAKDTSIKKEFTKYLNDIADVYGYEVKNIREIAPKVKNKDTMAFGEDKSYNYTAEFYKNGKAVSVIKTKFTPDFTSVIFNDVPYSESVSDTSISRNKNLFNISQAIQRDSIQNEFLNKSDDVKFATRRTEERQLNEIPAIVKENLNSFLNKLLDIDATIMRVQYDDTGAISINYKTKDGDFKQITKDDPYSHDSDSYYGFNRDNIHKYEYAIKGEEALNKFLTDRVENKSYSEKLFNYLKEWEPETKEELTKATPILKPLKDNQVDTKNFKNWFKDSKVVDENGNPLVVYHGSMFKDINIFDSERANRQLYGEGFYFAEDIDLATEYATNKFVNTAGEVYKTYLKIENPFTLNSENVDTSLESLGLDESDFTKSKMKSLGYDGIYVEDLGYWIAFEPNQIKSATDNNGNFDINNDDIRFATRSKQEIDNIKTPLLTVLKATNDTQLRAGIKSIHNIEVSKDINLTDIFREAINVMSENTEDFNVNKEAFKEVLIDVGVEFNEADAISHYMTNIIDTAKKSAKEITPQATNVITSSAKKSKEALSDKTNRLFKDTYAELFDDKIYAKDISEDLYTKARTSTTSNGVIDNILSNRLTDKNGNEISKSVKDLFKDVFEDGKEVDFMKYTTHKNNISRSLQNKSTYFKELNGNLEAFSPTDSAKIVAELEAKYPDFAEKQAELTKWLNDFMENWAVKTGLISRAQFNEMKDLYPFYITTNKDFDAGELIYSGNYGGKGFVDKTSPTKKLKQGGSARDILDIQENIINLVAKTVRTAKMNEVGQEFLKAVRQNEALKDIAREVALTDSLVKEGAYMSANTVRILEDGKGVFVEVNDKNILDMLEAVNTPDFIKIEQFSRTALNGVKQLITTKNPLFAVRNTARDLITYSVNSTEKSAKKRFANLWKAAGLISKEIVGKNMANTELALYRAMGISSSKYSAKESHKTLQNLTQRKAMFEDNKLIGYEDIPKLKKGIYKILDFLENITGASEDAFRLAEFIGALERGESIEQATLKGMEITTDFTRKGRTSKHIDSYVMYFNSGMQGFDRFGRQLINQPTQTLTRALIYTVAPALLWAGLNRNDEEYELLDDRTKDNNYLIPMYLFGGERGQYIKIPKAREYGMVAMLAERLIYGSGFKNLGRDIAENILPPNPIEDNVITDLAKYSLDDARDFAGRYIVPKELQGKDKKEQYDDDTTVLNKWLGQLTGLSPKKLDYYLDQYSGIIGDVIMPLLTPSTYATSDDTVSKIAAPLLSPFVADNAKSSSSSSNYYDYTSELDKLIDKEQDGLTTTEKKKYSGEVETFKSYIEDTYGDDIEELNDLLEDESLTASEKREVKRLKNKAMKMANDEIKLFLSPKNR